MRSELSWWPGGFPILSGHGSVPAERVEVILGDKVHEPVFAPFV